MNSKGGGRSAKVPAKAVPGVDSPENPKAAAKMQQPRKVARVSGAEQGRAKRGGY